MELNKGVPLGSILGPLVFDIFINDLFLFNENCTSYNYADGSSMPYSSSTLQTVLSNLCFNCKIATDWFNENGMKTNPNKFQFFTLSPNFTNIELNKNTTLKSKRSVKTLCVTIHYRLMFNDHISACCLKAAWQLHWLEFHNILTQNKKKIIFISFIRSNFEYCPLVWHLCGKMNNQKLEKLQE